MKKTLSIIIAILFAGLGILSAQTSPDFYFDDEPGTHNMGITSDGEYYFTCNGGKVQEGKISKYSLSGNFMKSYDIELDMRSIMYNPKDKHLYVNCYDQNIYRITNLEDGSFQLVFSELHNNEQVSLALDPKGKYFHCFDNGSLTIYNLDDGSVKERLYGLQCGPDLLSGNSTVAVSKKYIITSNTEKQLLYCYDKKGNLKETIEYNKGDYGFSLSYANGMIFIAKDGDYSMGSWYGYEVK